MGIRLRMGEVTRRAMVGTVAAGVVVGLVVTVAAPVSAAPTARTPRVSAAIAGVDQFRIDRQDPIVVSATFTGVDARTKVKVSWGDGTTAAGKGRCTTKKAIANPQGCRVTLDHVYAQAGQFPVVATAPGVNVTRAFSVVAAPTRWSPPAGWVQPSGWATFGNGATFTTCETVPWYFDPTGQSADRATMKADVANGLSMLEGMSGLRFVETTDPAQAKLTLNWGDLGSYGADVAGVGGPRDWSRGAVTFSTTSEWTKDVWGGTNFIRREWDTPDGWHWWQENPGRVWLVIHEVMHAMGFAHVSDQTQVMNPVAGRSEWGTGDLDGLNTMYKATPCPVIPD